MKDEIIKKYVRDLNGLLEEMSEVQAIPGVTMNENAVIFLFGRIFRFLNFDDVTIGHEKGTGDLDAWACRGQLETIIEFESRSKNFDHDTNKCDLIVCWDDNWKECPIDVLELEYFWKKAQEKFCKR